MEININPTDEFYEGIHRITMTRWHYSPEIHKNVCREHIVILPDGNTTFSYYYRESADAPLKKEYTKHIQVEPEVFTQLCESALKCLQGKTDYGMNIDDSSAVIKLFGPGYTIELQYGLESEYESVEHLVYQMEKLEPFDDESERENCKNEEYK